MTQPTTLSRRRYLSSVVGVPIGIDLLRSSDDSVQLNAKKFIIRPDILPEEFKIGQDTGKIFDHLRLSDPLFVDADVAANGFWAGPDQNNPLWVVGSGACVTDRQAPVDSAIQATAQAHEKFIEEYEAETPPSWLLDQQYANDAAHHEWRATIYITSPVSDVEPPAKQTDPTFIDTIWMQYYGPVLLWTVLFGPTNGKGLYEEFLRMIGSHQYSRVKAYCTPELPH